MRLTDEQQLEEIEARTGDTAIRTGPKEGQPERWNLACPLSYLRGRLSPERLDARVEQQLDLFADRTSAAIRLYLSSAAYMLIHALRRLGLKSRETDTRRKILIGAMVLNQADQNPEGSVVAWIIPPPSPGH